MFTWVPFIHQLASKSSLAEGPPPVFQYAAEHKLFWQITAYKPLLAMPEEPVGFTTLWIWFGSLYCYGQNCIKGLIEFRALTLQLIGLWCTQSLESQPCENYMCAMNAQIEILYKLYEKFWLKTINENFTHKRISGWIELQGFQPYKNFWLNRGPWRSSGRTSVLLHHSCPADSSLQSILGVSPYSGTANAKRNGLF